ncbi:MAG: hypothetical protein KME15_22935 [Drouetiella hepatica Uher 2000/2452]|uniref:Uncharacterized protein n=1 Tax=Drouetiella hepatica Uher 2000/2452 TaxID=904376 RepID=A0A951UP40_9CYAN|nr:hypothetical protein [Drouetiella hepatica Uher 2000/2452]
MDLGTLSQGDFFNHDVCGWRSLHLFNPSPSIQAPEQTSIPGEGDRPS